MSIRLPEDHDRGVRKAKRISPPALRNDRPSRAHITEAAFTNSPKGKYRQTTSVCQVFAPTLRTEGFAAQARRGGGSKRVARGVELMRGSGNANKVSLGFGIPATAYDPWRQQLRDKGVKIESEATWPKGSHSLTFRDPDGHLLELVTPGIWPNY